MPLTAFQREVARTLAAHRNPESHVAGGAVIIERRRAIMVWAACGKDPGYTPPLLLDQVNRHVRFQESDLRGEHLAHPVDLRQLKSQWLAVREQAEFLCSRLPAEELGCLCLDARNQAVTPDPGAATFVGLKRHRGTVRGAWPKIS